MRRLIGLFLIVALTILASLASDLRDAMWASYRDYDSPYLAELPSGSPRQSLAVRTVVVLVRGLRLDASKQMAALNDLRRQGADNIVLHQAPTYRLPSWLTLASGSSAAIHGATNNAPSQVGNVDTIFHAMRMAGQPTALIGSQSLLDLFGGEVGRFEQIDEQGADERDEAALAAALRVLGDFANPAQLVVLELSLPDAMARFGESSYAVAIATTDERIRKLADAMNLGADALIVASDRGLTNLDRPKAPVGQDGGDESEVAQAPLVMAGAAIRPGSQAIASANDIAPTLAALTGSPMPVHNQGQIILADLLIPDETTLPSAATTTTTTETSTAASGAGGPMSRKGELLWASALQLTLFYESWSEVVGQTRFAPELLKRNEAALKAGDERAYYAFAASLTERARAGQADRLAGERLWRLPLFIGAVFLMMAMIGVLVGARLWQAIAGVLVYLALWFLLFNLGSNYWHSLTMFAGGNPRAFLDMVKQEAVLVTAILGVLAALTTGSHDDGLQAITTVMSVYGFVVITLLVSVMWFFRQWGIAYSWLLPDTSALVGAMVALTQIASLSVELAPGLLSIPLPLAMAVLTLPIYALVRQRYTRDRFGRFGGR